LSSDGLEPRVCAERASIVTKPSYMAPVVVWRLPVKRGPATPLVIFLHGRGADENDLIDLATLLPRTFAYASLRGPLPMVEGGFCWFESRGVARPIGKSLKDAVAGVRAWLDGPDAAGYDRSRTYLFGFSQGMMLAGALLLDDPVRFAGGVLLSGAIALDVSSATPGRLAGIPIFVAHGTADAVIPADLVLQTNRYLRERSGAVLTERTYPRDHSIARREVDDIAAWFGERA
jgi:phospholipase/carboxylesterase